MNGHSWLFVSNYIPILVAIPFDNCRFKFTLTLRWPGYDDGLNSFICLSVSIARLISQLIIWWTWNSSVLYRYLSNSEQVSTLFNQFNLAYITVLISELALSFLNLFIIIVLLLSIAFLVRVDFEVASLLFKCQAIFFREKLTEGLAQVASLFDEFNDVHFLFQLLSSLFKGAFIPIFTVTALNATNPWHQVVFAIREAAHFHTYVTATFTFNSMDLITIFSFHFKKPWYHIVVDSVKVPRSKK